MRSGPKHMDFDFNPRYREVATVYFRSPTTFSVFQSTLPRGSDTQADQADRIIDNFNPRYREVATAKIRNITHIIFAQSIIQTYNYPVSTNKSDFSKSTAHPTQTILVRTSRQFYVHLRFAPATAPCSHSSQLIFFSVFHKHLHNLRNVHCMIIFIRIPFLIIFLIQEIITGHWITV